MCFVNVRRAAGLEPAAGVHNEVADVVEAVEDVAALEGMS